MKQKNRLKPLLTRWGKGLDRNNPLPEYPRPQMRRQQWQSLNGVWKYAICDGEDQGVPAGFDGEIVVPFSPESLLSGVGRQLLPGQMLWYRRSAVFEKPAGKRVLLHFGAVDQYCAVYCNGQKAGSHAGGYWPFWVDITDYITGEETVIDVSVMDFSDKSDEAYGKQKLRRGGIWYTAQSGIWQTVWAETVPEHYIQSYMVTPLYDEAAVRFLVEWGGKGAPVPVTAEIYDGDAKVAQGTFDGGEFTLPLPGFKSWSPDSPFLYDVVLRAGQDEIKGYFGMRKFGIVKDGAGHPRLALNNNPLFHNGLLDQGYWSDGLYTPPSDEAMVWEISELKRLGFNMLRKHIKIEPMRWYYHCDRLGMLVWQDFVNGGGPYNPAVIQVAPFMGGRLDDKRHGLFGRKKQAGRKNFLRDMNRTVRQLYNCASLAVWVPFNEGWGQFDALRVCKKLRGMDGTRAIDHASGWYDQGGGDFCSKHVYYKRFVMKKDPLGRVQALTEFGGYSSPAEGHMASPKLFGYKMYPGKQALSAAVEELYEREVLPNIAQGLSAVVYTQVSDVEDEINGVFSYDRELCKIDQATLRRINAKLKL